jgi:hypothetical protein
MQVAIRRTAPIRLILIFPPLNSAAFSPRNSPKDCN